MSRCQLGFECREPGPQALKLSAFLCRLGRRPLVRNAPPTIRPIGHGPDPEEWPKRMQREEAHPSRRMDCILMRMVARLGDHWRNDGDRGDAMTRDHDNQ